MGIKVEKTEHSGAKHGQGGYYGPKKLAKEGSNRLRREAAKREIQAAVKDTQTGRS